MSERSGRSIVVLPVWQSAVPIAPRAITLMMHVLTAGLSRLGMGNGAPKRQSLAVQLRSLPVSAGVIWESASVLPLHLALVINTLMSGSGAGSGTDSAPPPKYNPPHLSTREIPLLTSTRPQSPVPTSVTKRREVGSGSPQVQSGADIHWQVLLQNSPTAQSVEPLLGSHSALPLTTPSPQAGGSVVVVGWHATVRGRHLTVTLSRSVRGRMPRGAWAVMFTLALPSPLGRPFLSSFMGMVVPAVSPQRAPVSEFGFWTFHFILPRLTMLTLSSALGAVHAIRLGSVWLIQMEAWTLHRLSPQEPTSQAAPSVQRTILFFRTSSLEFVIPFTSNSA